MNHEIPKKSKAVYIGPARHPWFKRLRIYRIEYFGDRGIVKVVGEQQESVLSEYKLHGIKKQKFYQDFRFMNMNEFNELFRIVR